MRIILITAIAALRPALIASTGDFGLPGFPGNLFPSLPPGASPYPSLPPMTLPTLPPGVSPYPSFGGFPHFEDHFSPFPSLPPGVLPPGMPLPDGGSFLDMIGNAMETLQRGGERLRNATGSDFIPRDVMEMASRTLEKRSQDGGAREIEEVRRDCERSC